MDKSKKKLQRSALIPMDDKKEQREQQQNLPLHSKHNNMVWTFHGRLIIVIVNSYYSIEKRNT
eukprot:scaffold405_cov132-Cylindrotheca_fusiformis.AAC.9